jgi:glycosyltransferase involved in cell wall biosynthesis
MISILMPLYNGIEYLEEGIKSVKAQTFTEWELLIGINGHPAFSEVYQAATKYSSDKIFVTDFPELKGKSVTLNKLLTFAKFDSICLLDVDDLWAPEKLISQMPYVDRYDVIGTNCQYFDEADSFPRLYKGELTELDFSDINTIINSSCMINRRGRDIYWDSSWDGVEDYDLWIRLVREGWTFFNIETLLVKHRIHKNSFFNTKNRSLSETLRKERFNK